MYINIETTDNGYIVRIAKQGEYDQQEVRVYTKLADVMKWLKQMLEPEPTAQ